MEEMIKINKGLTINRLPPPTYDYFTNLAKEQFSNDYGMTIAHLCHIHQGLMPIQGEELNMELKRLNDEIELLKKQFNEKKEEQNTRKMMDGTRRE